MTEAKAGQAARVDAGLEEHPKLPFPYEKAKEQAKIKIAARIAEREADKAIRAWDKARGVKAKPKTTATMKESDQPRLF